MGEPLEERRIGHTTVLFGENGGKYPSGNSLLVEGSAETVLIDPSLGVIPRKDELPTVDRVLNSHCHEDHVAGNFLFPDASCHLHELDLPGMRSIDDFMEIYGMAEPFLTAWRKLCIEQFHYVPRPDAEAFREGDVFDLGGVLVRVIHTPGHTRGHCAFHIEPDDVIYLGDIDLSSFGPYYGDAWSDLESFERTLELVASLEAAHYATFHHIGVLDGREAFLKRLERFRAVIPRREQRLLEFLAEPRTIDEVAEYRCVYRPTDPVAAAEPVERRSMQQHIDRLLRNERVREVEPGRYRAA